VLNGLRWKELGLSPPQAEFTPFNLSDLRQTPWRPAEPRKAREPQPERATRVEALA